MLWPLLCLAQAPPYTITTVAGSGCAVTGCTGGSSGDGGAATSAQLNGPFGLLFDSSGNLYIADSNNNRVRKISNGSISTVAGNGTAGFAGDGSSATASGTELNSPSGVTFDSKGNMYIADSGNYEVREVSGGNISTFAGKNTLGAGFGGNLGAAVNAQMDNPSSVAVDASGNVYIADPGANVVSVVCANQTPIACTNNVFGSATFAAGDISTFAGNQASGCGYSGDGGLATGAQLCNPNGVFLDAAGNLYIADTGNHAIRKVNTSGVISTVAGNGVFGYSGDGGPAIQATLNNPKGVAVDASDNIYIADSDNSVIRLVDSNGTIVTIAGNQALGPGWSGDGGAATSAQLFFPSGVAVHGGNVYISDSANNAIRLLTPVAEVPKVNAGGVVNGASFAAPVVPGSIASVFGDFFLTSTSVDTALPLSINLGNLSFQFGGTAAPLFFVSGGQANVQVPWEVAQQSSTTITPMLFSSTGTAQSVTVAQFAPAIFTQNAQGTGAGAILDQNYKPINAANPAVAGTTTILIYCTGLGAVTSNQPATGAPASTNSNNLAHTSTTPTVTIGGLTANVTFSGLAPGYVGLYQVNAEVPAGVASGAAVPVVVSMGTVNSNTVTIAVQ